MMTHFLKDYIDVDKKQERLHALERQILRVRRRLERLATISNRYSWIRVALFFGGFALGITGFLLIAWWFGLLLLLLALLLFSVVAHFQGQIDRSMNRHRFWLRIKSTHIARMQLNWEAIPPAYVPERLDDHPFENDLDISGNRSVHHLLNTAVSRDGTQRLLNWLLTFTPELAVVQQRQQLVRELLPLTRFRDKLTLKAMLSARAINTQLEESRLTRWLQQPMPTQSLLPLLLGMSVLSGVSILLLLLSVLANFPQYWILTFFCSLALFFSTAKQRGDLFEDAYYLRDAFLTLSNIFSYLETYRYGNKHALKKLCEPFFATPEQRPSLLVRRIARIATVSTLEKNVLLRVIINAFVPVETYAAYRLRHYKAQVAEHLPVWLECWFELEALCSLATFAYLNPAYILPELQAQGEGTLFTARSLGHPLLPDGKKVTNDFALQEMGQIVIITGSNMSGKSTFLRTLGVNLCLAYAGGPVDATLLQTRLFRLFTCIRVNDSVTDGYSYFYAEVRRLKALLAAAKEQTDVPLFFLIDEIFRGTNNRERLIGSRSYIRALARQHCLGVISTHDLELVKIAQHLPLVSNDHFREDVLNGCMVFDYTLRAGPSPTTNALKIMRLEGLPVEEEEGV